MNRADHFIIQWYLKGSLEMLENVVY